MQIYSLAQHPEVIAAKQVQMDELGHFTACLRGRERERRRKKKDMNIINVDSGSCIVYSVVPVEVLSEHRNEYDKAAKVALKHQLKTSKRGAQIYGNYCLWE